MNLSNHSSFNTPSKQPFIHIAIVIFQHGKILLYPFQDSAHNRYWTLPMSSFTDGKSLKESVKRAVKEQTGLHATSIQNGLWYSDESSHHYTLFTIVDRFQGTLTTQAEWFDYFSLPTTLSPLVLNLSHHPEFLHQLAYFTLAKGIAYLASPYAHSDPLIKQKRLSNVTKYAAELYDKGVFVYSPLTHNVQLDAFSNRLGWNKWRDFDFTMLLKCEKMILLQQPGWEKSIGVKEEMEFAKLHKIPIEMVPYTQDAVATVNSN